jgi:competence ComEA-like helix-hairpin-helix protein
MSRVLLATLLFCLSLCASPAAASQKPASDPTKPAQAGAIVNLNTATAAELATLPGIGAKAAERIIEHRQKSGGFKKVEETMEISSSPLILLRILDLTLSKRSPRIAKSLSKSRCESQVVGAVVGATPKCRWI